MNRPNARQWVVLWAGAFWVVLALALVDEYVWRAVLAGVIISGLACWQLQGAGEGASSKVLGEPEQTVIRPQRTYRPARPNRLVSAGFLLLIGSLNSSALPPPTGGAEAVGSALALLTFLFAAVWLIATGLPRNTDLGSDLTKTRRRIWLRLVAAGFPVMAISAVIAAYFSLFVVAVLITWAYWFGWTILAWRIADRRAKENALQGLAR